MKSKQPAPGFSLPFVSKRFVWLPALLLLSACGSPGDDGPAQKGFEVKFLVGSALGEFCQQAATQLNQQRPKLENGQPFYLSCQELGSGDVVKTVTQLAENLKSGTVKPESPEFPTLISVDGEIYHNQLIHQMGRIFPGQNYVPAIADTPLLANSPMVFMAPEEVAAGLKKTPDLFKALVTAEKHRDLDASSAQLPVRYVQTAPTRSNSGLQTLVAQFVSVSGKRPEQLTVADVQTYQGDIQKIQSKVTRYGASTSSLAKDMVKNGPFWASIASVYESSVIAANAHQQGGERYVAIYPKVTFTSNMRAILPNAPWVSADEKAAAEQVIEFLRSQPVQEIAVGLGLRPGIPGVALGAQFSPQFGVDAQASYDSLRPPEPEVVDAMLQSWQQFAKKPSQVAIVVDSSGSMNGPKLTAVQNTLRTYVKSLGPKEEIALIDFDEQIRAPVSADGSPAGRDRGMEFIVNLKADGGTRLYDATQYAHNWLQQRYRPDAINAVLILTDGEDSGSVISLEQLATELKKSGLSTDQRIAFFTVGYGQEGEFKPEVLTQIAELNGGYYRKGDPTTIAQLMADLQVEF